MNSNKSIAILIGLVATFFLTTTFLLNRMMSLQGGSWVWSSSLRFYWMLPFLLALILSRKKFKELITAMRAQPWEWFLWSTIGFGVFYSTLTFAAAYAPSWLVASTWQVTIVAGILIAPMINSSAIKGGISFKTLGFSMIILVGIVIMQISQAQSMTKKELLLGTIPVVIASFAYPMGNRKMMQITQGKLDAFQRLLGMTIASLPFWILLSIYGISIGSYPSNEQLFQTFIVAICSGIIATGLFFMATDRVRTDEQSLAAVEATQSAGVVFALIAEIILLDIALPDIYSTVGIGLVILGMILHSTKKTRI